MSYTSFAGSKQPISGVEVVNIGGELTVDEFEEFATTLTIPAHFDMAGTQIGTEPAVQLGDTIVASRTTDSPRDSWAPDHHWHSDRTYWGENQFASVLYAKKLLGNVATTGFIDTALLLQTMEADEPGLIEELANSEAVFSVRRYYEEILPAKGSPESIEKTITSRGVKTLAQVIALETAKYPEKRFPALPVHPFRGELCTMLDDSRIVALSGLTSTRSLEIINRARDYYLNLPIEELSQRPYHYLHHWEEGEAVIYPQVGTLHRAMPSPSGERQRDTLRLFIV